MNESSHESHVKRGLVISRAIRIPHSEFTITFSRSSGPGGQNVNKVNSKASLRWPVLESASLPGEVKERFVSKYRRRITRQGEFILTSQRYRDQNRNVADCLEKLQAMIETVAKRPRSRKRTEPSRASRERRLRTKHERSERKQRRRQPNAE